MAEMTATMKVETEVELVPGEKTAAWLMSLGWTPPAEAIEPPPAEPMVPSRGLAEARQAMTARQAGFYRAQQLRETLKAEVSSPERVDEMLVMAGVPLGRLDNAAQATAPVVEPVLESDSATAVS